MKKFKFFIISVFVIIMFSFNNTSATIKKTQKESNAYKKTLANNIKKIKKIVEENFDYVGDQFTDEAKKIKYGEGEDRAIYGEANLDQTKELIEEEIDFQPLPWSPNKKNN